MLAVLSNGPLVDALVRTDGKAEIVGGRIVRLVSTGYLPGTIALRLGAALLVYADARGAQVARDTVGFLVDLPNRRSFSPDAALFFGPPPNPMRFVQGAPLFAVEVRSENDYGPAADRAIAAKRADYFAAGTRAVWDLDPLSADATVRLFTASAPDRPAVFGRGDTAHAEPALPGWSVPVASLFPPEER